MKLNLILFKSRGILKERRRDWRGEGGWAVLRSWERKGRATGVEFDRMQGGLCGLQKGSSGCYNSFGGKNRREKKHLKAEGRGGPMGSPVVLW